MSRKKRGSNPPGEEAKQAGGRKAARRSEQVSSSQVGSDCGWEYFSQQYGLDGTFDDAFARWLETESHDYGPPFSAPEPERPVTQQLLEQLGLDELPEISDGMPTQPEHEELMLDLLLEDPTVSSNGGLDVDLACYRAAIEPVRSALAAALEMLQKHEVQRGRRLPFRPDPIPALLLMRDILARALPEMKPSSLFRTEDPKKRMVLRDELILLLLRQRISPKTISVYLRENGYIDKEANERVINTVAFRLRKMGHSIPPSPTARNRRRQKRHSDN
jgi:hypothetical protein